MVIRLRDFQGSASYNYIKFNVNMYESVVQIAKKWLLVPNGGTKKFFASRLVIHLRSIKCYDGPL